MASFVLLQYERQSAPVQVELVISVPEGYMMEERQSTVSSSPRVVKKELAVTRRPEVVAEEAADSLAQRSSAPVSPSPASGSASGEASIGMGGNGPARELDASALYALELRRLIESKKNYPAIARRMGKQGKVVVRFSLHRDGSVSRAEILQGSEHDVLNRAAQQLVEQVHSFKPFPQEITKNTWDFVVPIEYRL